jgi:hypothetical protein
MPSRYDSTFWLQRAHETQALSEQMKDVEARGGMTRLARKYERIALQSAYNEARIAFDSAREALRVSEGAASNEQIASIAETVDTARSEMRAARAAMEVFRRAHLLIADGDAAIDGEGGTAVPANP